MSSTINFRGGPPEDNEDLEIHSGMAWGVEGRRVAMGPGSLALSVEPVDPCVRRRRMSRNGRKT